MEYNLTPDNNKPLAEKPSIGVYAVTLTGITKTITHMGVYLNSDDAINTALDHVARYNPQMHLQVLQKKGYWDVAIQYIYHAKAVEQFNYLLELPPLEEVKQDIEAKIEAPKPVEIKPETLEALEKNRIKAEKNKKLLKLLEMGSLTALELEKDNLTSAEYQLIYDKIK